MVRIAKHLARSDSYTAIGECSQATPSVGWISRASFREESM
jgi:hypothetical protein